jgi:hypothetical protein
MRILPAWLREFVNVATDDRQLAEDLTSAGIVADVFERFSSLREKISMLLRTQSYDGTSAAGAKELSPALQRWVRRLQRTESRRDDRRERVCRAYGTRIVPYVYPALKRWAKLFRPAGGTVSFAFTDLSHCRNTNSNSALPAASPMGAA